MVDVHDDGELQWWATEDGEREVGRLRGLIRPDLRCFLFAAPCPNEVFAALLTAAATGSDRQLFMEIGEDDAERLACLEGLSFVVGRREHHYVLPTDPRRNGLAGCRPPRGIVVRSAAEVDVDRWRLLDDVLRQDVPGTSGWRNDPERFAADAFGDPEFDPATYLIAVREAPQDPEDAGDADAYVGLVRVWNCQPMPRLGLIGVTSGHRRHGLARALLAAAFQVLHERGQAEVSCEVDATNLASATLMTSLGARRQGGALELVR